MRQIPILFILLLSVGDVYAQEPAWQHTTIQDPLTDKTVDRLVLVGEYLVAPGPGSLTSILPPNLPNGILMPVTETPKPKLVLVCSNRKLIQQYGVVASGLAITPSPLAGIARGADTKIDFVIDGSQKKTASANAIRTNDRVLTEDNPQRYYIAFELGNILAEILRGKSITIVARDNLSGMSSTVVPRQVLMEFHIPDPSPLIAACGEDRVLRGLKP